MENPQVGPSGRVRSGIAYARVMPASPLSASRLRSLAASAGCLGGSGRAAGRRFPASSSPRSIRARSTGSRHGFPLVASSCRRRTGRRRRRRWRRRSSAHASARAQRRGREPRLGRRLLPPLAPTAPSSGCSRSTSLRYRSCCARLQPRVLCLGNLFRDQLDRYGELELVAERWRDAVDELPDSSQVVFNADDPQLAAIGTARAGSVAFGLDDPRVARESLQHAADSKYCLTCGAPLEYAAAYVGHLGDFRCPNRPHEPPAARGRRAGDRARGLERAAFLLVTPEGERRVELSLPGLYNVYNALAAAALARALGASLDEIAARARAVLRRVRAVRADRGRRQANPSAPDQEPRRRERGRCGRSSTADRRACSSPRSTTRSRTGATCRGSGMSTSNRSCLASRRIVASGGRAAELALRFRYGGLDDEAIEVEPDLATAARPRARADARRGRARRPPHLHRDARTAAHPHQPRD